MSLDDPFTISVLATVVGGILLTVVIKFGSRLISSIRSRSTNHFARKKYIRALRQNCETLIVIGQRKGVSLESTFVPLEIERSDLDKSSKPDEFEPAYLGYPPLEQSCVLVGAPGAGKSTIVKKAIWKHLGSGLVSCI